MYKTKIDWCDSTWNPVTGCLHECPYCYARRMVKRFGKELPDASGYGVANFNERLHLLENRVEGNPYPYLFEPTFHAYRLEDPKKWTEPRTIFVCSMADLFGEWVPEEWILDVFRAMQDAPQHRYLMLTKNPSRFSRIPEEYFRGNAEIWIGTTVTGRNDFERLLDLSDSWKTGAKWFVSAEPLLEDISDDLADCFSAMDWVIVGAESGNRRDKVVPRREWIERIVRCCEPVGTPVFMKESVRKIMGDGFRQDFPWKKSEAV